MPSEADMGHTIMAIAGLKYYKEHIGRGENMSIENEIAIELQALRKTLKEKGLGDNFSIVVVSGVRKTGHITCTHLIDTSFVEPTVDALDKMVCVMKVGGGNGINVSHGVLTEDKDGHVELLGEGDIDKLRQIVDERMLSHFKEQWDTLVDTIGEAEARKQFLTPIVTTIIVKHGAWDSCDLDKKISLVAEFLAEVKTNVPDTDWLPYDYSDKEITDTIKYVEHLKNFGYAPTKKDDVAFG